MTIRFLTNYPPYVVGNSATLDSATETSLVAKGIATTDLTGAVLYVAPSVKATGAWIPLTLPYTLTKDDDGKCYAIAGAGTLTVPAGLSPRPSCVLMPPATGSLTLAGQVTGTRARTGNPAGVALNAYQDSDGYGLSGS